MEKNLEAAELVTEEVAKIGAKAPFSWLVVAAGVGAASLLAVATVFGVKKIKAKKVAKAQLANSEKDAEAEEAK